MTSLQFLASEFPRGTVCYNEYDNFTGEVVGHYLTNEGKMGVVLQQVGTRVVHVYGIHRLEKQ